DDLLGGALEVRRGEADAEVRVARGVGLEVAEDAGTDAQHDGAFGGQRGEREVAGLEGVEAEGAGAVGHAEAEAAQRLLEDRRGELRRAAGGPQAALAGAVEVLLEERGRGLHDRRLRAGG